MKTTTFLSVLFAIYLSSCTTVYYTQSYEDANYLTQDEFADFEDYTSAEESEIEDENINNEAKSHQQTTKIYNEEHEKYLDERNKNIAI